jgi:hypothetical protein
MSASRRGKRRGHGPWAHTLALFDPLGITKRKHDVRIALSDDGIAALRALSADLDVHPSGLAAFLVESYVRKQEAVA